VLVQDLVRMEETAIAYLVAHGESAVVRCGPPDVGNEGYIGKVDQIEPAIKNKPACRPVVRDKVFVSLACESPAVDEKEGEDDDDGGQDAPPKLLVHGRLDRLLPLEKVPQSEVETVKRPYVESSECGCKRKNHQKDERASILWRYRE